MKSLTRLTIAARLRLAFGLLILLLALICGYGATSASRLAGDLGATAHVDLQRVQMVQSLQQRAGVVARATREMLLTDSAGQIKKLREAATKATADSGELLQKLAAAGEDAEVAAVRGGQDDFVKAVDKYLKTLADGNQDDARSTLLLELRPMQASYEKALDELTQAVAGQATERATAGGRTARLTLV
ncbi:MAG: MCP four helix bundle domain-containing protein, partial [Rubrivivax sp.]